MAAVEGGRLEARAAGRTRGRQRRAPAPSLVRRGRGRRRGHTAKPRPKGHGPRPLTAAVFWRQRAPPPAKPERRLPALSGLNCPPAGRGGGMAMGEGARGGHVEPEGSGINSRQHGSSRRGRRSSNMASGARGQPSRAGLARGSLTPSRAPVQGVWACSSPAPILTPQSRGSGGGGSLGSGGGSGGPAPGALAPRTFLLGMVATAAGRKRWTRGCSGARALAGPGVVLASSSSHCSGSGGFIKFL